MREGLLLMKTLILCFIHIVVPIRKTIIQNAFVKIYLVDIGK